jgi:peroxiredoxin
MYSSGYRISPLTYILIGLLLGGGVGFLIFWGFPKQGQSETVPTGIDSDAIMPDEIISVSDGQASFGLQVGSPAPDFVLEDATGEEYRLSDLRGNIVLLNFWATWCGPCLVEMPLLETEYQVYKDEGFIILAVNDGESAERVANFGEENGLNFPLLLDPSGVVQRLYEIRGYPSSVFVDEEGRVKFIHIGLIQKNQLATYMQEIGFGS